MTQEPNIFPYIARLLQGAEVVWKPLGEVITTITAPTKLNRSEYKQEGSIPIIDQGIDFIAGYTDESFTPVKSDTYVLFGDHSEHIKYVDFAFIQGADGLKILKPKEGNAKYIYYAFINFYHKQLNYKRHWSVAKETIIPLPPLSVQQEIVRILDKFTQLEAELEAELDCRKRQYEYYRNNLLTYEENQVEWKTLGEIAIIGTGSRNTNEAIESGKYPFFVRSQEPKTINEYEFDETAIITAGDGVGVGKVFHYVSGKYALHQRAYRIVVTDENISPKFLFYYIRHNFPDYLKKKSVSSSVTSLRKPMFEKYPIFIPPLEEQNRIVAILDKFDTLVNSISEGLPKEIALRRKQYEYYREKLLTFTNDK
jgi:type I restriction enzyme specificity protein hsdS